MKKKEEHKKEKHQEVEKIIHNAGKVFHVSEKKAHGVVHDRQHKIKHRLKQHIHHEQHKKHHEPHAGQDHGQHAVQHSHVEHHHAEHHQPHVEHQHIEHSHEQHKVQGNSDAEMSKRPDADEIKRVSVVVANLKKEVAKAVTGQEEIVDSLIRALICDGHVLLEGVPGIAKTLAIKTLAIVSGCSSKRIQFTVDLLPTDITGVTTYTPGKGFETIKGPIFANFVIADEINRSPSKTQSALIEAMQEKQVTIGKQTFFLSPPFFVMATQNPLEQSGVYSLPEAQVDRFLFKLIMGYPKYHDEEKIMGENMTLKKFEEFNLKAVTTPEEIMKMQVLTKRIYIDDKIKKYILDIVTKSRTKDFKDGHYIDWGGSPRASIALFIASKAEALMRGRNFVIPSDVRRVAHEVLRHRIILTYRAKAEGITSDKIVDEILSKEHA